MERGWTLTLVVDRGGLTRSYFYDVIAGRSVPTLKWIAQVAEAFELSPFELLGVVPVNGVAKKSRK